MSSHFSKKIKNMPVPPVRSVLNALSLFSVRKDLKGCDLFMLIVSASLLLGGALCRFYQASTLAVGLEAIAKDIGEVRRFGVELPVVSLFYGVAGLLFLEKIGGVIAVLLIQYVEKQIYTRRALALIPPDNLVSNQRGSGITGRLQATLRSKYLYTTLVNVWSTLFDSAVGVALSFHYFDWQASGIILGYVIASSVTESVLWRCSQKRVREYRLEGLRARILQDVKGQSVINEEMLSKAVSGFYEAKFGLDLANVAWASQILVDSAACVLVIYHLHPHGGLGEGDVSKVSFLVGYIFNLSRMYAKVTRSLQESMNEYHQLFPTRSNLADDQLSLLSS